MKTPDEVSPIPPEILRKLQEVRRRDWRVRFATGWLRGVAVLLAGMLVAMLLDWTFVLYDPRARWTLTLTALGSAAAALVVWGIIPVLRGRSLASIARDVDQAHPTLQERYSTLTEVAQSSDAPELRGSDAMLRKVAQQASDLSAGVTADAVVRRAGLVRAWKFAAVAGVLLLLFFAVDFSRAKILCARFWFPGGNIAMTRINAIPGDVTIGRGESITLEFVSTGKKTGSANLFLRLAGGKSDTVALTRTMATNSSFIYVRNAVTEAFDYRARSGDGQTAWHHVAVADRPTLSQFKLKIVPPAYSKLPVVEEKTMPHRLRALEGSDFEASFQADQPLTGMALKFADGALQPITEIGDHTYTFHAQLTNTFTFTPVFTNEYHLDNQPKPSCQIVVFKDEAPTVKVFTPDSDITARPDDKVKIYFEARDDFGIADAKLVVTKKSDAGTETKVIPIPLNGDAGKRQVRKQVELDLAQFNLKQDQELSYVIQVTDTKANLASGSGANDQATQQAGQPNPSSQPREPGQLAQAQTEKSPATQPNQNQQSQSQLEKAQSPSSQQASASQQQAGGSQVNSNRKPTAAQSHQFQPSQQKDPAQSQQAAQNQNSQTGDQEQKNPALRPDSQIHIAMASAKPSEPRESSPGSQPPPNDMSKRVLDAGQCSACQPMHILVDEWGRSFEGQQREKLEIAIDPVLRQLDELLKKAQELTDSTLATGRVAKAVSRQESPAIEGSQDQLRQADAAVTELKGKTQGTPYAFVGLQIHDIRQSYINPARRDLGAVSLEPARGTEDLANLEHASFQIKTARQKLADLTRTYAAAKRDYKLADAMQRLKKMHQIFIEDTQAMLGSSKPTLNPQQRKVAEVDDEFVAKFQKLLEEKKKIMAELAKILADDPRMLRRFLALEELEGTSLRDQMTLLAQRQQALTDQGAKWSGAEEKDRHALLDQALIAQADDQTEVAGMASTMHDNMVTWVPLEVPVEDKSIVECQNIAAEAASYAADASAKAAPATIDAGLDSGTKSLEQMRHLNAALYGNQIEQSSPKFAVFVSNRMHENATLITRESGWIRKVTAIRSGDYPQAAEVDQHRLTLDTTTLSEKLDAASAAFGGMSPEIHAKADELMNTVHKQILPEETSAMDALSHKEMKEASTHQTGATVAFATAEKQFDDLLHLIIAKLDAEPPPTGAGQPKSLEEILAMLQDEKKAAEGLGIPCRPINVNIQRDWMRASSNPGNSMARAQAMAAQQQAKLAMERAKRLSEAVRKQVTETAGNEKNLPRSGPKKPRQSWNTLVSQLGDELRQSRDNVPPEQYRQAIESYFNTISDKIPVATTSTNSVVQ